MHDHFRSRIARETAASLQAIAARRPRIHCITNAVAMNYTANALLAVGAIPSMTLSVEEIAAFADRADALMVNLGTLDDARRLAIEIALDAAADKAQPWVLDPVFVDVSPPRLAYARRLLERNPAVLRANADEIRALSDASCDIAALARRWGCAIAQSGAPDRLSDGRRSIRLDNGHPMMARVTALGCALSALVAAFLSVETNALNAAAQALLSLAVAGEAAAEQAGGPGSLQIAILDRLYTLDRTTLERRGRAESMPAPSW